MIDQVWSRITELAGQPFTMIRGEQFTYSAHNTYIELHRTNRNIHYHDFEKALQRLPLTATTKLQDLQGPSFIFAILNDPRIRRNDY